MKPEARARLREEALRIKTAREARQTERSSVVKTARDQRDQKDRKKDRKEKTAVSLQEAKEFASEAGLTTKEWIWLDREWEKQKRRR